MAQIFHPSANTISLVVLLVVLGTVSGALYAALVRSKSTYSNKVGVPRAQPIMFSHEHHAGGLGIDCRYCHSAVEESSFAGIPATEVCMTCHSQIWTEAPILEPVRRSWSARQPLLWHRVYDLPDFVYFNHSIHIAKGVGCSTCHGRVDQMPLTWRNQALHMSWCLGCHRDPAAALRPKSEIYNMSWTPPKDPKQAAELGARLAKENKLRPDGLTDCWTCHR